MFFIRQNNSLYSGNKEGDSDRQLSEGETEIIISGAVYKIRDGIVVEVSKDEDFTKIQITERRDEFYKNFIKTSLGCIRLMVNFNGVDISFIAVLPNYSFEVLATQKLKAGRIIFYNEPDFTKTDSILTTYESEEMTASQYMPFLNEVVTKFADLNKIR